MSLTEDLLETYKQQIDALELQPYGDGRFEVFLDGEKVFSKLDVDRFPEHDEIHPEVESRL